MCDDWRVDVTDQKWGERCRLGMSIEITPRSAFASHDNRTTWMPRHCCPTWHKSGAILPMKLNEIASVREKATARSPGQGCRTKGAVNSKLLADIGGGMIPAMGQDRKQATPDLFSTAPFGETSPSATKPVASAAPERRHILPKDLPSAIKHLTDQELDSLIAASLAEAKRRGRSPAGIQTDEPVAKRSSQTDDRRQGEVAVSLTRGQINAVRAAFIVGVLDASTSPPKE
jgi:hypothetical protein